MDNAPNNANGSLFISIILGIFSWFTPERVDTSLKVITGLGAIISAIMAARYYYTATKLKKEQIKRLKNSDEDDNE